MFKKYTKIFLLYDYFKGVSKLTKIMGGLSAVSIETTGLDKHDSAIVSELTSFGTAKN
ncbi:hypothetical protein A5881_001963 [Enterococcus termitis]